MQMRMIIKSFLQFAFLMRFKVYSLAGKASKWMRRSESAVEAALAAAGHIKDRTRAVGCLVGQQPQDCGGNLLRCASTLHRY